MTPSSILAAIGRALHLTPAMPNNTALADATRKLQDATAALTTERQHTAAQAQQLVTLQREFDAEHAARVAAEERADTLQAQLDQLPDAATVAAAVDAETQAAQVIGAGSPEAQAATPSTPVASA